ncbi:MAG: hypothetical protein ACOX2A_05300 [Tepidanaerobacteraceae bacterium]|jgi:tRNA A-37 threonylcarbamoyl transferase component Bud32|nr:hypothetical protein [Thermoanaerobacterales bacterium]
MNLKREIYDKLKSDFCFIEKQFQSKKNQVYLINFLDSEKQNRKCVLKEYRSLSGFEKELTILEGLKNLYIRVPKIFNRGCNYILMEYIDGCTLTEFFEKMEKDTLPPEECYVVADELCRWLADFYKGVKVITDKQLIMKDVNLRNFIVSGSYIYGIDFEDVGEGSCEEDVGKICAFLVTYYPEYTEWKLKLSKYFRDNAIKILKLNQELVMHEFFNELKAIEKRRKS